MTSDDMLSVSPIWQLGHIGKGVDVFASLRSMGIAHCSVRTTAQLFNPLVLAMQHQRTCAETQRRSVCRTQYEPAEK